MKITVKKAGMRSKTLWFVGGVIATLSTTVLLTNFIHPDRYEAFRGNNYLMSAWNGLIDIFAIGSINPLWINATIVMLSAALPMFYAVMKHTIYSESGRRKKLSILLPLLYLPIFSIFSASLYKPYRAPAESSTDRSLINTISEWGNNLLYGGAIGLLASLLFAIAVIILVKRYRLAIGLTLLVLLIFQVLGILQK